VVGSTKEVIVTGSSVILELGSSTHNAKITKVSEVMEFTTGKKINSSGGIRYSNTGKAEIRFSGNPVALDISKNDRVTKYISLRGSSGETIAMGRIIKVICINIS
jgi:translation elongation factor EF-1alpha